MINNDVRVVFLLTALLAASCGPGPSPTAPTAPTASVTVPTFTPGTYTLMLSSPGTPPPPQPGDLNFISVVCVTVGGGAVGYATLDVTVDVQGTQIVGRSTNGSLVLSVQPFGADIAGGLSGSATSSAAGVSVAVRPKAGETSIGLRGTVTSSRTMSGYADGSIQFDRSSGSYSCNSADWSLSPR
jgi:hypothetical protein